MTKTKSIIQPKVTAKKMVKAIEFMTKAIPKGNANQKDLIKAFEKIDKNVKKTDVYLFDISKHLYADDMPTFEKFDRFFKKVHKFIRKNAEKSPLLEKNLEEVLLNNYRANTGVTFSKKQGLKAYELTLDHYDPNETQSVRKKFWNWSGFWSLISTKNGEVEGVWLSDTADRDYFYKFLKKSK